MVIVDSQVHAYEANSPKRPWHSVPSQCSLHCAITSVALRSLVPQLKKSPA